MIPWQAQLELVKSLLVSPEVIQELTGVLKPLHFENVALGWIAEGAMQSYAKYRTPPTEGQLKEYATTLPENLNAAIVSWLPDVIAASNPHPRWAIETGRKLAARAELVALGTELAELADKAQFDQVLARARTASILASPRGEISRGAGDQAEILARHQASVQGIPTGITRLDKCLSGGGLHRGAMAHILGKKGGGKSHALTHMGASCLAQPYEYRVLHVTCEMPAREVRARYDRNFTEAAGSEFLRILAQPTTIPFLRSLHDRLTILEATRRNLSVGGIESALDRLGYPVDMVIVDYLQLLSPGALSPSEDPVRARQGALGRMSMDLHILAQERNVALWTAYQSNRAGIQAIRRDTDVLDTTHYAESIAAAWPAEVIVSLNQTITEAGSNSGRVFIAENRSGRSMVTIECLFDWRISKIKDLLDPTFHPSGQTTQEGNIVPMEKKHDDGDLCNPGDSGSQEAQGHAHTARA